MPQKKGSYPTVDEQNEIRQKPRLILSRFVKKQGFKEITSISS